MKKTKEASSTKKTTRPKRRGPTSAKQPELSKVPTKGPNGYEPVPGVAARAAKPRPASRSNAADRQADAKSPAPGGAPKASGWAAVIPLFNRAREAARTRAEYWESLLDLMRTFKDAPDPEYVRLIAAELRKHAGEVAAVAGALDQLAAGRSSPSAPSGDELRGAGALPPAPGSTTGSSVLARAREALRRAREKAGQ